MKILRSLMVASAAFFYVGAASAQNAGTVTNHALAVGKGAGKTGYTSVLLGSGQLAVGQSAADPSPITLSGDVTMSAAGVTAIGSLKVLTAMIANNAVTLAKLATIANNTALCNVVGSTAVPTACTQAQMTALINTFTATLAGTVPAPGTATGKYLRDDGTWQAVAGAGTVTSVQISAGQGITVATTSGANPCVTTCNLTVSANHTLLTSSLSSDATIVTAGTYALGPAVAQGSTGTWWASGTVTLSDSAVTQYTCKLWDGSTVVDSTSQTTTAVSVRQSISLSGFISSPGSNIRIDCTSTTSGTGGIRANATALGKDSTLSVMRVQ